jgi:hypothetical protein
MITLTAATITKIVQELPRDRLVRIYSDSTTITRLARERDVLEQTGGGVQLTAYESIVFNLKAGQEIFAIHAATPHISVVEINANGEAIL